MKKTTSLPFVMTFIVVLFVALPPTRAATVYFEGFVRSVDDHDHKLDGSVVVGGAFSGRYTFDTSVPPSYLSSTRATYDYAGTAQMTMTVTVGNYTFETAPAGDGLIDVYNDYSGGSPPHDSLHARSHGLVQKAGPNLGAFSSGDLSFSLQYGDTSAITSLRPPESLPSVHLFELGYITLALIDAFWIQVEGRPGFYAPNVVGLPQAEAEAALEAVGLKVRVYMIASDTVSGGHVISQDPSGLVVRGSEVTLMIAEGGGTGPGQTTANLVAHWKLDETAGVVVSDSSSNGNHGVLSATGARWVAGYLGGALDFTGEDGYVTVPNALTLNPSTAITIMAWLKPTWTGNNRVLQKGMWSPQYALFSEGGTSFAFQLGGSDNRKLYGFPAPPAGQWHHVAATYDGAAMKVYYDGAVVAQQPATGLILTFSDPLYIGAVRPHGALGEEYRGAMDDVRLYDRALSESQIAEAMAPPSGGGGTALPVAVAHWRLDESAGPIASDSSGAGHDGTVHGNPLWQPAGGKLDGALLFDGIDDYVDCGTFNPSAATGRLSVCLWAKWNGLSGRHQGLVGKTDSWSANDMMWQIEADGPTGTLCFYREGMAQYVGDPVSLPVGEWAHVACTFDGAIAKVYLDAAQTSSRQFSFGPDANAHVVLGTTDKNTGDMFKGALDDVRICDQALSESQIKAVMAGAASEPTDGGPEPAPGGTPPAGLLAHWALDEASGRVASDSVGGFDGFLMGGPIWQPSAGKVGGALDFDGSNDVVVTDFVLDPADGPFSVFAWIRGGAYGGVILSQEGSAGGADWLLADAAGRLKTSLTGSTGGRELSLSSAKNIVDGRWHEVGFVWDGANRTLYVDGVAVAEDGQTQLRGSTGGLNIGAGKDLDADTFWSGLIDEVRIYNRAGTP